METKLQALWTKLTADKVLDADDRAKLEEAGMSKEESIKRARNEELTVKINGNKAAEEGVGDKITFTTYVDNTEQTVRVPVDKDVKVLASNNEVKKTLSNDAQYVEYRTINNQYVGVRADGSTQVLEDLALIAEGVKADERQKELAESERAKNAARNAFAVTATMAAGVGTAATAGAGAIVVKAAAATGLASLYGCINGLDEREMSNTQIGIQDSSSLAEAVIKLNTQLAQSNAIIAGYLSQLTASLNTLSANYNAEAEKNKVFREKALKLLQLISDGVNSKLPESLKTYYEHVVNAIDTNGEKLDELINLMQLLNAKADSMAAEQKEATKSILEALKNMNFNMVGGMNAILKAILYGNITLDKISGKVDKIINMLDNLQKLMKKYGEKLCNVILKGIAKIDGDFTVVEDLIKQLIKGQEVNGDKIDNLTAVVENMGLNILTKLDRQAPDYSAQLSTITNLLMNIKPSEVDLTKLEKLVGNAVTGVNNNTQLLKELKNQNDIIIDLLKSFRKEVGDKFDGVDAWLELIYKKIPTGGTGGCKCDINELIAKLDEILAAIKDHKVKVTVEGGKCNCTCDGQPVQVHEGVLGNLQDILG